MTFNVAIQDGTFTLAGVDGLNGPAGSITPAAVTKLSNTQYQVSFADQTAPGNYTLTIGPNIKDLFGDPMDQNGNAHPGENPGDLFTTTFGLPLPATLPFQENFDDGIAHGFVSQSGSWSVSAGRYGAAPSAVGGDAVSLLQVSGALPSSLEFDVTMNATAAAGSFFSNGFIVFDYQSPTNFKYAGAFVGLQQWVVGHRDANGWHIDAVRQRSEHRAGHRLQPATLAARGQRDSAGQRRQQGRLTATPRRFTGSVGLGTQNSLTQFDNLDRPAVQPAGRGHAADSGEFRRWPGPLLQPAVGQLVRQCRPLRCRPHRGRRRRGQHPAHQRRAAEQPGVRRDDERGGRGRQLFQQRLPHLRLPRARRTSSSPARSSACSEWVVGHRDANGWQVDALLGDSGITAGTDYNLQLLLQGNSASLLVNGVSKVNHTYAAAFSGSVGLGTQNSLTQFDNLTVKESYRMRE